MRFLLILWVLRTYLDSWVKNQWMGGIWISHNDAWYCQSLLTPVVEGKADGSQYCVSVFILFMVWQSQRINAPDIVVGDTYHVILYTTILPPSSCERWMLSSIKCCATLNYFSQWSPVLHVHKALPINMCLNCDHFSLFWLFLLLRDEYLDTIDKKPLGEERNLDY